MVTDWQQMLKKQWELNTERFAQAVADVTPEEAQARPQNLAPIVWQLGHVTYYDAMLMRRAGLEHDLPADYEKMFPIGTDGRGPLPPLADVLTEFHRGSRRLIELIEDASALARPTTGTANYNTLADGLIYVLGHREYHRGKVMTLRALLGKPRIR
ncbi:MAG: DinB family protein [Firmicutes bacterium]|nr:DinB family protein [Bacillota bacterium]